MIQEAKEIWEFGLANQTTQYLSATLNTRADKAYVFPPFALIEKVLAKAMRYKSMLIIITPVWPWCTQLFRMHMQDPVFIPAFPNIWTDPN